MSDTRALPLALVLLLVPALAPAPATTLAPRNVSASRHCADLEVEVLGRADVQLVLVYDTPVAHAAAALLRAALLAGWRAPALLRPLRAARLCHLRDTPDPASSEVTVAVAAAWAPTDPCAWDATSVRAQGVGAAPLTARLHAHLARPAARDATCRGAREFHRDRALLRACLFLRGEDPAEQVTVYVPHGEWSTAREDLAARLKASAALPLRIETVDRASLERHVTDDLDRSFLFLDAELWAEEANVTLALPPGDVTAPLSTDISLRVADEYALRTRAATSVRQLVGSFTPSAGDLRRVLASTDLAETACELAARSAQRRDWMERAARPVPYSARGYLCSADPGARDFRLYSLALAAMRDPVRNLTDAVGLRIEMQVALYNCSDPSASKLLIRNLLNENSRGALADAAGLVVAGELAGPLVPYARDLGVPLVTYGVLGAPAPPARTVTGRAPQLAATLARLLAACEWRRVAVVSARSAQAAALAAGLRAAVDTEGLLLREVQLEARPTPAEWNSTLDELLAMDVRVFLVNADAAGCAGALAAAAARGLTPAAGYVWLVREYNASDAATAALCPYSVTYQWRGEPPGERGESSRERGESSRERGESPGRHAGARADLYARIDRVLGKGGRAWPLHAAAIADAFLTIADGLTELVSRDRFMRDYYSTYANKTSQFWSVFSDKNVSGVVGNLMYDEHGVTAAPIYVERWGNQSRPQHLFPSEPGGCPAPERRPRDRPAPACMLLAGDPFHPACRDLAWLGGGAALAACCAALAAAALWARGALRRRDARVRELATAQLLSRRELAFAALAPHVVDRAALELREELGAGRFGRVRLAVLRRAPRARPELLAAKALREDAAPAEESQFLREACTLAALRHDHVVRFAGVCVAGGPPLLLMERAHFGDLLRYLRARRHLAAGGSPAEGEERAGPEEAEHVSAAALTRLAREAAAALAYLAGRALVHRDVRAANCLVDGRRALKLADFGLARGTGSADGEYACRGRALFPVLWMAPESLESGVASAASDAWAFGVLALELVTLGARPFGAAAPPEVVRRVLAGGRPPLPRDACAATRALTAACWRREPHARPAAARLAGWLAARCDALRPALASEMDEPDCDSGFGDLAAPAS